MIRNFSIGFCLTMLVVAGIAADDADDGSGQTRRAKVLRDNVNLRAKPSMSVEVVVQVSAPDELTVKSVTEEWVEVVPPEHADLWILGDYIQDGMVRCERRVNVRAGAGINFNIVGQLSNGAPVTVRGEHADWIKIAPVAAASLWVARPLVELPQPEPQPEQVPAPIPDEPLQPEPGREFEVAEAPAPADEEQPRTSVPIEPPEYSRIPETRSPTPTPASISPPSDLNLNPTMAQGQWRQYEGVLRPRDFLFGAPSKYRLAEERNGSAITICHVRGNNAQLRALLNRRMTISGREYWVLHQSSPVLVPERIVLK